ncbi:MAG: (2Fe-2S)-binding protein [Gemmatimonadetes bacterium]|nr:(2Fe-2S)-binding protein [Gemmatimonadota bacterium]MCA9761624.1 (2Fe-2S)-binding protein [Gemmatimonadota bacterium]MCA9768653.1 (2Fe-2S)-binding protein [Gemmatimonadota bacterium]HPF60655.1 hypothetical protein [Gemmatimonadales bacterium]HRX19777.1 hypothetical protein [Gemmatimonadales bacterium]
MNWSYPVTIDRCVCQRMLFATLHRLAEAEAWDLETLIEATGCGDQCGMCRPYLRRMLRDGTTVFHQVLSMEDEPG